MELKMRNNLLAHLPEQEFRELFPLLTRVWLPADTQLLSVEEQPDYAYFPENSIVAVITCDDHDRNCYVGFYGFEGFGSLATVLGIPTSANHEIVQFGGFAYQIRTNELRRLFNSLRGLRRLLLCYVHVFMMQLAGTVLSGSTRVEQRLARLLLMYQDRIRTSSIAITHQRLSEMLGVRRSGITEAVHVLEGEKLIRAHRGVLDILDRSRLVLLTAGCYGKPEAEYRRLI